MEKLATSFSHNAVGQRGKNGWTYIMCAMYLWEHEFIQFNRAAWLFQHAGLDFSAALPVADLFTMPQVIYTYKS